MISSDFDFKKDLFYLMIKINKSIHDIEINSIWLRFCPWIFGRQHILDQYLDNFRHKKGRSSRVL